MSVSSLATGPGTVDALLGNAYQIVKEVQENLPALIAVSAIAADVQQVIDNLNDVESVLQALLATTAGAAMIGTSEAGIDVEEALAARPKATTLALTTGAASIGTSEAGITVEEALAARPTTTDLAETTAAAGIGSVAPSGATVAAALLGLVPTLVTELHIYDMTHAINTTGKFVGKGVINTDDNKLYIAHAANTVGIWWSADGVDSITPA